MKITTLLFVSLALILAVSQPAFSQNDPCPVKSRKTDETDLPGNQPPPTLQLTKGQAGQILTIDRAVLEIRFNQKVEDIDRQFHTPPALQTPPATQPDLGCLTPRSAPTAVQ